METRARAQELIDQLGQDIGIEGLAFDEGGVIDLDLDDNRRLNLGLDPATGAILALGPLSGPADAVATWTLRRLLETGAAGGPAVALDDANDRFCLQDCIPLQGLGYAAFKERLLAFIEAQDRWLAELAAETGTASGRQHGLSEAGHAAGGLIRA